MQAEATQATPQAPPAPPAPLSTGNIVVGGEALTSPAASYQAARAQRRELVGQMEQLEETRSDITQELINPKTEGVDRAGLEARLKGVDGRIASLETQIAAADAAVARAAGLPGATVQPREPPRQGPPGEAFALGGLFMVVAILPIALAYARRIWRRSPTVVTSLPPEVGDRFTRLEQAMDSVAVEVERIGEGQRFVTRLFTEGATPRALGMGAAEKVELKVKDAEHLRR